MSIRILITGGTVDKEYNELKGTLTFHKTHIMEILKQGRVKVPVNVEHVEMIDSLDMVLKDRLLILMRCQKATEKHIVITHGTDTMVETAKVLGEQVGKMLRGKTIVLTGAMVPYTFGNSDAMMNLGCAMAFTQSLPAGVYIAMNGKYFLWKEVNKNKRKGIFESLKR